MCTSPRNVQYNPDGSLNFSKRYHNPEMVPFKVPCGKCIECLLERARDWSVRCVHEASVHAASSFVTLTYAPEHLPPDGKLNHTHFQAFMYRLRKEFGEGIGFFMCGEYGEQTLRPHYHACLFGVDFLDKKRIRQNHNGDYCYNSELLTSLWKLGHTELGSVTQQSAGYVARYVLKKQNPEAPQGYQKMSRQHAIGKRFIERWYKDIFIHARGSIVLSDGTRTKVPRYYEKWLRENHPDIWLCYITKTKHENTLRLKEKAEKEHAIFLEERLKTDNPHAYKSPLARKRAILKAKIKRLQRNHL